MIHVAIYVVAFATLTALVLKRPHLAIVALLSVQVLDFWGQMSHPFFVENPRTTNVGIVLLVLLAVARKLLTGTIKWINSPSALLLIALWAFALLSYFWTPVPHEAIDQWSRYWPYMILSSLIIPITVDSQSELAEAFLALTVFGGVLAALVAGFVVWDGRYVVSFYSATTKFWNALAFAQLAGYTALAAGLMNWKRSVGWIVLRIMVLCVCAILIVKSGSRGQFALMLALVLALLPVSESYGNWRAYASVLILAAAVGLATYIAFEYFSETQSSDRWSKERFDEDLAGRIGMATNVVSYWWRAADNNVATLFLGLGTSASFAPYINGFYPHMVPLEVLAEEGLIGAAFLVSLNVLFLVRAVRAIRMSRSNPSLRGVFSILIAAYLFGMTLSFKQGSLLNMSSEIFLFLIILERVVFLERRRSVGERESSKVIVSPAYPNICP